MALGGFRETMNRHRRHVLRAAIAVMSSNITAKALNPVWQLGRGRRSGP